jgi:succinoglycan biosynthesis transport protein ExoP
VDEIVEDGRTFAEYLEIVRRRWIAAAIAFAVVLVIASTVAIVLPPVYRSTATILIEQQEIPEDLVRSTITSFADQRIQVIRQRVMTTSNLLDIIREHGLYANDIDRKPREVILERMRSDIHVNTVSANVVDPRSGAPRAATIAFTVGYDNRSPDLAVRVANQLTSLFLQQNSQTRRQQAAEASSFLADEAKRLNGEVGALESKLADFKLANSDRLPDLAQLNLQLVSRAEQDLADAKRQRSVLEQQRAFVDAELAQLSPTRSGGDGATDDPASRLRALEAFLSSVRGVYTPDHPDVVRAERRIAALREELGISGESRGDIEKELADLRAQRAALLEHDEEAHPDVVRLDRQIEAATEKLEAEAGNDSAGSGAEPKADNPAYIQLAAQRNSTDVEIKALVGREADLRKRLAALENRVLQAPAVERDYYSIARDLDTARRQYLEVSAKQREAVVAENLEIDSKSEHFNLIEPPLLPQRPVEPNRWMILSLGAVLALAVGFGVIFLRELIDGSVTGARELERLTRNIPLGVIPAIVTPDELRARSRQRKQIALATAGTLLVLVALTHFFVAPVDALWFAALRRFGA